MVLLTVFGCFRWVKVLNFAMKRPCFCALKLHLSSVLNTLQFVLLTLCCWFNATEQKLGVVISKALASIFIIVIIMDINNKTDWPESNASSGDKWRLQRKRIESYLQWNIIRVSKSNKDVWGLLNIFSSNIGWIPVILYSLPLRTATL